MTVVSTCFFSLGFTHLTLQILEFSLGLANNRFTGTIPDEIGQLSSLFIIDACTFR
jgi:hypothetical protein